jgi:benzylsuccinate CoA-transferase BbsF subunit
VPPAGRLASGSGGDVGPFAGLRVLDFSWVGAGPLTTLQLAVYGAEVIRVESTLRPDVLRLSPPFVGGEPNLETSGYFFPLNAGKRSLALNLATDAGRAIARRLATICDIVVDSFTPRVMPSWGLDQATLRRERPDLIVLSLSMVGATGPDRDALGFGTVLQAAAGYPAVTGWPDRGPVAPGIPFTDWIAPFAVLPTLLAAVAHRQRTGEGCFLDASQLEATVTLFREPVVATQCGDAPSRAGNRLLAAGIDIAVPHGVYPCRGDDRWLAIACLQDAEWSRLAAVIGDPPVSARAPLAERRPARLAIDTWIARWSIEHDGDEAAALLQAAGVPAAPVRDVAAAAGDAQLRAWGFGTILEHPVAGPTPYDPPAFRLVRSPACLRPAPVLGADTELVIRELLGLSDEDWNQLVAAGAFL